MWLGVVMLKVYFATEKAIGNDFSIHHCLAEHGAL